VVKIWKSIVVFQNKFGSVIYNYYLCHMNQILVGHKGGFQVYFNPNTQTYSVYKDGKFVIGNKFKFSQVKSYLD
jgi:hypothetical protein